MAAEIKRQTDVEPELVEGAGGIFDIEVDGRMIYSKHQTGRFPEHQEVLNALPANDG